MALTVHFVTVAMRCRSLALWLTVLITCSTRGADIPKMPVPSSPYVALVYRYADTMLEHGRDPQKTGLFLSALDRATLQPLTNRPAAPIGVREQDRVGASGELLTGANPQHDENFLRLLYTLTELTTKTKYRDAADAELKWFLESATMTNAPLGFFRPWTLWERCFQLEPERASKIVEAADKMRIALPEQLRSQSMTTFDRQGGFLIRRWAVAYAKTKDAEFINRTSALLASLEKETNAGSSSSWPAVLSLAIDCDGAAHPVPEPLASRLRAFAARADESFCSLPHKLKETSGFVTGSEKKGNTPLWQAQYGRWTTAQIGMMCVSRYDNTGKVAYRDLVTAAADAYLNSLPEEKADVWPGTFGQAISLEIAAWRHTARLEYFDRARKLADIAIEKFLDKSPLPRASFKSQHYESITGADTLMLALLELHLNVLHITAVRCPPNTIDR